MRRDFIFSIGAMLALTAGMATAQVNDAPLTEGWAPSEWGADDLAGSVNRTTPEMVLKAVGSSNGVRSRRSARSMPETRRPSGLAAGA